MADNLHRQFDHIEDFEIERRQTTNYQDDQGLNSNSIKLQDMIFFGRVSSFCVSTVLVAFLFLVAQVATFWGTSLFLVGLWFRESIDTPFVRESIPQFQ